MSRDTIVDEVRKAQEYARKFNFDLDAICADLRRQQKLAGGPVVSLPKRPPSRSRSIEAMLEQSRPLSVSRFAPLIISSCRPSSASIRRRFRCGPQIDGAAADTKKTSHRVYRRRQRS